jgi:hypothetical protein
VSFLRDIGIPPWWAKSEISGNLVPVLLFLVLLVVLAALSLKDGAEISSIEIRSELPPAVEKSGEVVF